MSTWFIGAVINVVGSILINLGTNVMKLGHNKRSASDVPESSRRPIRKYREWQCGIALFAVGNVLNFVSFGFAAQSLLAALGSIQFVSNVFFAWFVLHERADRRIVIATAMIVTGCIVLVVFGNHQSRPLTTQQLIDYFQNDVYIAYLSWLLVTAGIAYIVYKFGSRKLKRDGLAGMSHRWMKALPISYSLFSGMIGTQSVLFSKALSTLLRTTIDGNSQLKSWFFWLVLVLFLCCAYFWVTRLNKALRLFPAVVIVPTMQISWTLFSVVSGGIYYQEYHAFTAFTASMFGLGVLIIFVGVYLLAGRTGHEQVAPGPTSCPCDPESVCSSRARISRATSAFALPGFGYIPANFDVQVASPRYLTLDEETKLAAGCGIARYNSVPCLQSALAPIQELSSVTSADSVIPAESGLVRGCSEPNMVRSLKHIYSLSDPPQSPHSPRSKSAADFAPFDSIHTAHSQLLPDSPGYDHSQQNAQDYAEVPGQILNSEQPDAGSTPMLGAFAPLSVRLQPSTSDVLAQLVTALPVLRSRTATVESEPNVATIPSMSASPKDSMV